MKPLTQNQLKQLLNYDPETGVFTWISNRSRTAKAGAVAGWIDGRGYIGIMINSCGYAAHRLAFLYMNGEISKKQVDHIDGDRANNCWSNLRLATNAENQQNVAIRKDNKSGRIGVSWNAKDGKWRARITKDSQQVYLGSYDSIDQANKAYLDAKSALHTFNAEPREYSSLAIRRAA